MASASCSSSYIPWGELHFCGPKLQFNLPTETKILGTYTQRPLFRNHLCVPRVKLLVYGKTPHRPSVVKQKQLGCGWEHYNQISRRFIFEDWCCEKGKTRLVKAIATVEPEVSVPVENDQSLQFEFNLEFQGLHALKVYSIDNDKKEKLRRMRISKANKGSVPWNKGRKHSPETLQRIQERTKLAMQNLKVMSCIGNPALEIQNRDFSIARHDFLSVKMKLVNLGHAQSEETRIKIGAGVRVGWQRRHEMLMVQDGCLFEWQNIIAEASQKGYASEDALRWDAYKIIDEQLKNEWLESVDKGKTIPRPKGSKRAPKSLEQRRKISEAISAKWADPEYRGRVCSALAKYHGVPVGVERKKRRRRRRPPGETSSVEREGAKRKSIPKGRDHEGNSTKKAPSRRKRNATPSYKDPLASPKLEMIRKIRAERAAMENKKKATIERAKLLIAEAEKAAKALELAALKSPLAQASLIETRKLIAEATRSIESIESGQVSSHDSGEASFTSDAPVNKFQSSHESFNIGTVLDERIDGFHLEKSYEKRYDSSPKAGDPFPSTSREELSINVQEDSGLEDVQANQPCINGSIKYIKPLPEREGTSKSKEGKGTKSASKTKKWLCGRLDEVDE